MIACWIEDGHMALNERVSCSSTIQALLEPMRSTGPAGCHDTVHLTAHPHRLPDRVLLYGLYALQRRDDDTAQLRNDMLLPCIIVIINSM